MPAGGLAASQGPTRAFHQVDDAGGVIGFGEAAAGGVGVLGPHLYEGVQQAGTGRCGGSEPAADRREYAVAGAGSGGGRT